MGLTEGENRLAVAGGREEVQGEGWSGVGLSRGKPSHLEKKQGAAVQQRNYVQSPGVNHNGKEYCNIVNQLHFKFLFLNLFKKKLIPVANRKSPSSLTWQPCDSPIFQPNHGLWLREAPHVSRTDSPASPRPVHTALSSRTRTRPSKPNQILPPLESCTVSQSEFTFFFPCFFVFPWPFHRILCCCCC